MAVVISAFKGLFSVWQCARGWLATAMQSLDEDDRDPHDPDLFW